MLKEIVLRVILNSMPNNLRERAWERTRQSPTCLSTELAETRLRASDVVVDSPIVRAGKVIPLI